jgi:hypothetical protein
MSGLANRLVMARGEIPEFIRWLRSLHIHVDLDEESGSPRVAWLGAYFAFRSSPESILLLVPQPLENLVRRFWYEQRPAPQPAPQSPPALPPRITPLHPDEVARRLAVRKQRAARGSLGARLRQEHIVELAAERARLCVVHGADWDRRDQALRALHHWAKHYTNADAVRYQHRQATCCECQEILWRGSGYYQPDPEGDPGACMCVGCQLQSGLSDAGRPRDGRPLNFEHDDDLATYWPTHMEAGFDY